MRQAGRPQDYKASLPLSREDGLLLRLRGYVVERGRHVDVLGHGLYRPVPAAAGRGGSWVGAVSLFLLRRLIFRSLAWVLTVIFCTALLAGMAGGVSLAYERSGFLVGTAAVAVAVAFLFLASRMIGPTENTSDADWISQDEESRQRREWQRRDDERNRRLHEELRRRNPW